MRNSPRYLVLLAAGVGGAVAFAGLTSTVMRSGVTGKSVKMVQGRREGTLHFRGSARELAEFQVVSLEGAMMLARSHGSEERFHSAKRLLADIGIS